MTTQVISIFILMIVLYASFLTFMYFKKKKQKNLLNNTNFNTEISKAETHKKEYLNSNLSFISKQMKGKSIDAFNFANLNYTRKDSIKDGIKDGLKGMATLGTVRFHTTQTPKYLILSGTDLHLLDTDTEGDISNHLVFDALRMGKSKIAEIPLEGMIKAFAKQKGELTKAYRISLSTDNDPIDLIIFSALIFTYSNTGANILSLNSNKELQEIIIGNDFLKKLGETYPNLKVPLPIFG
ncbi:MAG: hypothetical protein JKY08_03330 [Flavobacteriaceae bacterium]|nr:hypothetical protein [Flavobacteriaceae bacterium]